MATLSRIFLIVTFCGFSAAFAAATPTAVRVPYDQHLKSARWSMGTVTYSYRALPFKDWEKQHAYEGRVLKLFPDYREPERDSEDLASGGIRRAIEDQVVFVGRATFALNKKPDLELLRPLMSTQTLSEIEKLAMAGKEKNCRWPPGPLVHQVIAPDKLLVDRATKRPHNTPPTGAWCEPGRLCLESRWDYPSYLAGMLTVYSITEGKRKDTFQLGQGEARLLNASELSAIPDLKYLVPGAPLVGAVQQSTFYVNQLMRWGKNLVVLQSHPSQPDTTLVTSYFVIAVSKKYYDLKKSISGPEIRLADFFNGDSFLNCKNGTLMAGVPDYTTALAEALSVVLGR